MEFKSIEIKNFRNFKTLKVKIGNKNIFFGMNDIGKTNFLFALRYLFDRDIRKQDLVDSDFHKRNVSSNIEIVVEIDISDINSVDVQKLRAKLKGAISSNDKKVYIKFEATYNNQIKCAEIKIQWGSNRNKLRDMHSSNSFFEIDNVFNVNYINSYVDLHNLFRKNLRSLIKNVKEKEEVDNKTEMTIKAKVDEINQEIANLSGIQTFQDKLTPAYKKMRDEKVSIRLKPYFVINNLYSNIIPFIHQDDDSNEYPAAGEGRKKLLTYAVYDILSEDPEIEKKINIFLIEEPETHLHRSMQSALSHFLFGSNTNDNKMKYLFISTHSSFVLSEMDGVNLVRLYNDDKIVAASKSYIVPDEWKHAKKKLNRALSEAIFADTVLLVEGESECILFERVLTEIDPFYESKGIVILSVEGVGFKPYVNILSALGIKYVIKTDNDVAKVPKANPVKYKQVGFERVNGLMKYINKSIDSECILSVNNELTEDSKLLQYRRQYYEENKEKLDVIRKKYRIFLSHSDLEEDLCDCLNKSRFCELLNENTAADAIKRLKSKKHHKMVDLVSKLKKTDCNKIYHDYTFACLMEVCNETP